MKKYAIILAAALTPNLVSMATAAEKFAATNYYVTETKTWMTGEKSGYYMVNFRGVTEVSQGPIETLAVECNGSGFWGSGGLTASGICVNGSGDDTFTMRFDREKGAKITTWKILSGRGNYKGLTGKGTATTRKLPGKRRISKLVGEVELTQ